MSYNFQTILSSRIYFCSQAFKTSRLKACIWQKDLIFLDMTIYRCIFISWGTSIKYSFLQRNIVTSMVDEGRKKTTTKKKCINVIRMNMYRLSRAHWNLWTPLLAWHYLYRMLLLFSVDVVVVVVFDDRHHYQCICVYGFRIRSYMVK